MAQTATAGMLARQHLIDPEICIRCNTCEDTCPVDAITHDSRNYVVDFGKCNGCNDCISPCPTGAIDNWRQVKVSEVWSLEQQLQWDTLPAEQQFAEGEVGSAMPDDIARITDEASIGQGGPAKAPWSAAQPYTGLYTPQLPAIATVAGNFRLTGADAGSDIRHIVLDFGGLAFPILEGQSIGIIPPGVDADGRPHHVRLYSVASPRDGERHGYNNLALTIKRVTEDNDGKPWYGIGSNYMCDLKKGDKVQVTGPYGLTYLMPNHPGTKLMMICTGTGSAPMRAMTERRRRRMELKEGGEILLFFGARTRNELPYCGPLLKLPQELIDVQLAFSREPEQPKQYVQDRIRAQAAKVAAWLVEDNTYLYICGHKRMEEGVYAALEDVCRQHGLDWQLLMSQLRDSGRFHVETY
ncbi:MAG TPA: benzoyl-CoA 2,3-epoxidase subunit BoxA [Burkholderiaceae bacterium]|nr:benzoyl-CoA 2,3-epoxidase subunit BoxA [Burkholderiaceae bacterium]